MSMTRAKITSARRQAQRFIKACDAALQRLDEERTGEPSPGDYSYGSMETGTLRRQSMELTRSLAELRRRDTA